MFTTLKYIIKSVVNTATCMLFYWNDPSKLSYKQLFLGGFLVLIAIVVTLLSYYHSLRAGSTKIIAIFVTLRNLLICVIVVVFFACFVDLVRYIWKVIK